MSGYTFDEDGNLVLAVPGWIGLPEVVQDLFKDKGPSPSAKAVVKKAAKAAKRRS